MNSVNVIDCSVYASIMKYVIKYIKLINNSFKVTQCTAKLLMLTILTGSASITTCTLALPGVSRLNSGVRIVNPSLMAFSCTPFNYTINTQQPFQNASNRFHDCCLLRNRK